MIGWLRCGARDRDARARVWFCEGTGRCYVPGGMQDADADASGIACTHNSPRVVWEGRTPRAVAELREGMGESKSAWAKAVQEIAERA